MKAYAFSQKLFYGFPKASFPNSFHFTVAVDVADVRSILRKICEKLLLPKFTYTKVCALSPSLSLSCSVTAYVDMN